MIFVLPIWDRVKSIILEINVVVFGDANGNEYYDIVVDIYFQSPVRDRVKCVIHEMRRFGVSEVSTVMIMIIMMLMTKLPFG